MSNYNEYIEGDYIQLNGNFGIGVNKGKIQVEGDTTTSAENRAINAFSEIKGELFKNFSNLSSTLWGIDSNPPTTFLDIRRANETELAYQDRARNYFREYINSISIELRQLKFSAAVYESYKRDLSHDRDLAKHTINTYEQLDEVTDSFFRFESGLTHIIYLNLSDLERAAISTSLHKEKIANARIALSYAAAYLCLALTEEVDTQILSKSLKWAGINVNLQPGEEGYKEAGCTAKQFSREKKKISQERVEAVNTAREREIERCVKDPYLVMLRETSGLSANLSEGEVFALKNKEINRDEEKPEELFKLAAFSFFESDGHASTFYFKRALESNKLSSRQRKFAQLSVNRLEHPETYNGNIGVMVVRVTPGGNFDKAGLVEGDVVVSLNGKNLNEPGEISSELGKSGDSPLLVGIIRDGEPLRKVINGGESAGAALTQLIVLNTIQL